MRIRYLSDLHLEFSTEKPRPSSVGEDLVILAGDIEIGTAGIAWAQRAFPDVPVLYVLGNQEYYGHYFDDLILQSRAACAGSNVQLLENDSVVFDGVRFAGCSLWTDFQLLGEAHRADSLEHARLCMNDFFHISRGPAGLRRSLHPAETAERHRLSRRWLEHTLTASAEPVAVITHHAPCVGTSHPRYTRDPLSPAFASDLTPLLRPPVIAWICGHTPHCVDFDRAEIGRAHV